MTSPALRQTIDPAIADAELARRVAHGEDEAIRFLLKRHNQSLFRTARAILRDDAEAEDAVQEAYLKALRAMPGFRGDAKLSTWLVRIVVNEALTRLRRTRRGAEVIELEADGAHVPDHADTAPTPERVALGAEARRMIEAKIDALPDAFRAVFVLRAVEELSVEDAASALDIPEATVRSRFFRARGLLRESLAREFDSAMGEAFGFAGSRCDRIVETVLRRWREESAAP